MFVLNMIQKIAMCCVRMILANMIMKQRKCFVEEHGINTTATI